MDPTGAARYARWAERAAELARDSEVAAEPLQFAAKLFRAQGEAFAALRGLTGSLESDLPAVRKAVEPVLRCRPPGLADELLTDADLLDTFRAGTSGWLARAALQPYFAALRDAGIPPERARPDSRCPFCGGLPWVSSRVPETAGDGGRRLLHCSLCAHAWPVNRIRCAACGEEDPEKLPVFSEPAHPGARIEACETCSTYVKSIDRTDDMRRVPEVDDLASLPLDLWAEERGFTRLEPGVVL